MARLRKGHWRHIAANLEHADAFECGEHARVCRRVWVSPQQPADGEQPAEAPLFDLDPDQVAYNDRSVARRNPAVLRTQRSQAPAEDEQPALRPARRSLRDLLRGLLARLLGR